MSLSSKMGNIFSTSIGDRNSQLDHTKVVPIPKIKVVQEISHNRNSAKLTDDITSNNF
jgi:hypothetical protein